MSRQPLEEPLGLSEVIECARGHGQITQCCAGLGNDFVFFLNETESHRWVLHSETTSYDCAFIGLWYCFQPRFYNQEAKSLEDLRLW